MIGIFEVVLRNSIDKYFIALKGNEWLRNAVQPGGYLESKLGCEVSCYSVLESIKKLGSKYSHNQLISTLPLGFWTYQFAPKQYYAAGNTLLEIFPNRTIGTNQKKIFQLLIRINEIRNRIAHYEPICFNGYEISTEVAKSQYEIITDLLYWMGYNPRQLLYGIDKVQKVIKRIDSIMQ